ncbi:hypothetical protein JCM8202_004735 [Rhodotorula sphaerocarpa]
MQQRTAMRAPQATPDAHGSRTLTTTATPADGGAPAADESENPRDVGALRLRGRAMPTQRVQWTQETVDNEGLNRKKSKICCIYHKPKPYDESSDESGSDSADSDGSADSRHEGAGAARRRQRRAARHHHHHHHHDHDHEHGGECNGGPSTSPTARQTGTQTILETPPEDSAPAPEPNAYERPGGGKGKGRAT